MNGHLPPSLPAGRREFTARHVRGYLVVGPLPRWLVRDRGLARLAGSFFGTFLLYAGPFTLLIFLGSRPWRIIDDDLSGFLCCLIGAAAVGVGLMPLATWPIRLAFRVAAVAVAAIVNAGIAALWFVLLVEF